MGMGKFRIYSSGSGNISLTIGQRGLFEKKHPSSLPRARKPLYSGQKSFLRPYSPLIGLYLYWKVVLDFRFGHQKCLIRGRGKVYFLLSYFGARYENLRALFNTPQTSFWPSHFLLISLYFSSWLGFSLGPPLWWSQIHEARSVQGVPCELPPDTFSKYPLFRQFSLVNGWFRASKPILKTWEEDRFCHPVIGWSYWFIIFGFGGFI